MRIISLAVIGAGCRGNNYANYASEYPEEAKIIGVAEPRDFYRKQMALKHSIKPENCFNDWKELLARPKLADAVIIATPDNQHLEPAIAFADKGYNILLEKPMTQTEKGCRDITEAGLRNNIIFAVCHVMRYTAYSQKLKSLIDSGVIGELISIQHLEPLGYWHQAHSYVRGNWRNEHESTFMLMAKSCHDLDWLRYIVGTRCSKISSFGSLKHFVKKNKPIGASSRCMDCSCESQCPYSAGKIYLERAKRGEYGWPVDILTADLTLDGVTKALETGPYGRCVYECDNNVVDNQTVNMLFENGVTAVFTMTAFTKAADRKTRVFGSRGELYGNGSIIKHHNFLTDETIELDVNQSDGTINTGHGGGDYALMKSFITALVKNDKSYILSGPLETLESHLMVFAAEKARHQSSVIECNH
ncbi:MAG: Gfo/Idh/MocA family oxidoreductase [Phycisphaerales bacterium]